MRLLLSDALRQNGGVAGHHCQAFLLHFFATPAADCESTKKKYAKHITSGVAAFADDYAYSHHHFRCVFGALKMGAP